MLFSKYFAVFVFVLVWLEFLLISYQVHHLISKANYLVDNANNVINSTKPVIKKADKLLTLLLKDAKILDSSVWKIAPILEKTNKLLDISNKDMEILNMTLQNTKPILTKTNSFIQMANKDLESLQPTIDLLVKTTNSINGTVRTISTLLQATNVYLEKILSKIKF